MRCKVEKFTKENLPTVRAKMNEMFKAFEVETGIHLEVGNIRFDETEFGCKLTASLPLKIIPLLDSSNLKSQSWDPNHYIGKKFILDGKTFTVTDFKPNRPKYPYSFVSEFGKEFKGSTEMIKRLIVE